MEPWRQRFEDLFEYLFEDGRGLVVLRRAIVVVLVAGMVACAGEAGSGPDDPELLDPADAQGAVTSTPPAPSGPRTTVDVDGVVPDAVEAPPEAGVPATALPLTGTTRTPLLGFGEVLVQVRRVDGEVVEWCLMLAEGPAQTGRGLMEVTDPALGGYDGMLFRFPDDRVDGFYMRNVPVPLSIAYLNAAGAPVSVLEMQPCEDRDGCPTYPPDGPYRNTIEVPVAVGGVSALGIEAGAVVVDLSRACPPG